MAHLGLSSNLEGLTPLTPYPNPNLLHKIMNTKLPNTNFDQIHIFGKKIDYGTSIWSTDNDLSKKLGKIRYFFSLFKI